MSDRALTELNTVVGSVRGLIEAMTRTPIAMKEDNCEEFAAARF